MVDKTYIRPKLREGDQAIMDIALEMNFTDKQIQQINAARESKGVFYLSKIAEADGMTIRKENCAGEEANYRMTRKQVKTAQPNTRS